MSRFDCPQVRGPADLPALRQWLWERWQPGRPFHAAAMLHSPRASVDPQEAERIAAWNARALALGQLWWVTADMVALVGASADALPEVELHEELVPATPVVCILERPLLGIDAMHDDVPPVRVHGFVWDKSRCSSADDADELVPSMATTILGVVGDDPRDAELVREGFEEGLWVPLGRTDWRVGESWSTPMRAWLPEHNLRSHAEDRRWLTALWSLAVQPNVASASPYTLPRAERRRAARAGWPEPNVRVVALRPAVRAAAESQQASSRTYHVRWPVAGHWRNQAYGPGRSLRRPVWIAPYIKGPEDAPLKSGSTVYVLKGG